jgi:RNA 3'-terminal phosphate cyclase (ATP)
MSGTTDAVELDGFAGEGGGQILRTALALSLVTGRPFRIRNIRARRKKPGLAPQHLAAVRAAAEIGTARVQGAGLGSTALDFTPGGVRAGDYRFDIGTAGAVSLLLQTLLWPLALQAGPSSLVLTGGTHVPWAPTFEYMSLCWAPLLRRMGVPLTLRLARAGFYPKGGGKLRVELPGGATPRGVHWDAPVIFDAFTGISLQSGLREEVAERQAAGAREVLLAAGIRCPIATGVLKAVSPGTAVALVAGSRWAPVCATALGQRGRRAEAVGREAASALARLVAARAPVDPHAADQILLSLAGEPSVFLTSWFTDHLCTNARVIEHFLPMRILIAPEQQGRALVRIEPGD